MRRSLHVIRSIAPLRGGASASVPQLVSALSRTGRFACRLLTFRDEADDAVPCGLNDAELIALPWRPREFLTGGPLRTALKAAIETSDIVQIHGIWEPHCIAAGKLAFNAGIPYVVSAHGMLDPWAVRNKRWKKWAYALLFERRNLNRAACLHALTTSEVNDYRAFGVRPPVAVVPNGVAGAEADAGEFFRRYPELRDKTLLLYLSRIHYKKGVHLLCRVWARIHRDFPEAHLVLAGPDFEHTLAAVKHLVVELGIAGSVSFTGMLNATLKWSALAAASLFVLPSYSEGFSVAILEAMAAAVPVVITPQCHFPEVADYACGTIVEPREDELESALRTLLAAPAAGRRQMGLRGRTLVGERYNWDRLGSRMAAVYDWILGDPVPDDGSVHRVPVTV